MYLWSIDPLDQSWIPFDFIQRSACIPPAGFCPPPFYICALFSGRYFFIIADFLFNDKRRRADIISPFFHGVSFVSAVPARKRLQDRSTGLSYPFTIFGHGIHSDCRVFFAMQMHNKMAMCRLWRHALELKRVAVPLHMRKTSSVAYFAYDCGASEAHEVLYFSITPRGCNFEGFQPFQTICKKWPVMPDKSTGFVL